MEDVSWDGKKAPIFFFSPIINSLISSLNGRLHQLSSAVEHLLMLISCSVASLNKQKCFNSNFSANRVFASFFPRVTNKEVLNHWKPKRGSLMHSNMLYLKVRSGRSGSSGLSILGGEKKRKEEKSVCVLIKINHALVCFLFLDNHLSPFFTVLVYHHKHWCCAKKFTHLAQSEKAATVIAVMSSTSTHLLSRG